MTHQFTVTLDSGKVVTAEVEAQLIVDHNYGADADGNRGMRMSWLEDVGLTVPITEPEWDEDDEGAPLSQEERKEAERRLLKAAEDWGGWEDMARGDA